MDSPEGVPRKKKLEGVSGADPNTFSRRVGSEETLLPWFPNRSLRSTKLTLKGERLHRLAEGNLPVRQQVIARLLKGFVNVSDIVKVGDLWYSYAPKFKHIPHSDIHIVAADAWIASCLFGNSDRDIPIVGDTKLKRYPHNIKWKDGKHMLFDLESAPFWSPVFFDGNVSRMQRFADTTALGVVKDKTQAMVAHYGTRDGQERIRAILASASKEAGKEAGQIFDDPERKDHKDHTVDEFIDEFQRRLRKVHEVAERTIRHSPLA